MITRDFAKLNSFLMLIREGSFLAAAKKLNISQPAVSQHIQQIEEYMQVPLISRKRSGVELTKKGEQFYVLIRDLEAKIKETEEGIKKLQNQDDHIVVASCSAVGNYLLPCCVGEFRSTLELEMSLIVERSSQVDSWVLNDKADIAIYSPQAFDISLQYEEWIDDEIVAFSNQPMPSSIDENEMKSYQWFARDELSQTRKIAESKMKAAGLNCKELFDQKSLFSDAAAIKQAVLKAKDQKTAGIISKLAILDEISSKQLYISHIKGCQISRKLYIVYKKSRQNEPLIRDSVEFLQNKKELANLS